MSAFDAISGVEKLFARDLTKAMESVQAVHVSEVFIDECVELIGRTRNHPHLVLGCSPRAALALVQASRARAFIYGREYTIPEDLFALAEDVIMHRIRLSYEALADGLRARDVINELLESLV